MGTALQIIELMLIYVTPAVRDIIVNWKSGLATGTAPTKAEWQALYDKLKAMPPETWE